MPTLTLSAQGFVLKGHDNLPEGFERIRGEVVSRSPLAALPFIDCADSRTTAALEKAKASSLSSRSLFPKSGLKSNPRGLAYFPYQEAGIEWMRDRKRCLNADEPGTGKTIQVAGLINELPDIERVLIICPASLRINWEKELAKWVTLPRNTKIVSYDSLWRAKVAPEVLAFKPQLVVMDEAHYIKTSHTKRTQAALAVASSAERVVLLTGTPILNRPEELFVLANLLLPNMFSCYRDYTLRYCGAFLQEVVIKKRGGSEIRKKVWNVSGSSREKELQDILRTTVMIRRLKKDVLPQLPRKLRQIVEVSAEEKAIAAEQKEWKAVVKEHGYEVALKSLEEGVGVPFDQMAGARQEVALSKVKYVVEHVKNIAESQKVVLFAHHKAVIEALMEGLQEFNPVKLVGGMSDKAKDDSVVKFQNDESCRVFVGNVQAAGVGITLTAASTVVFAELVHTPALMTQAEDRCCRIGATSDKVLVQHIVLNGSLDVQIAKKLVLKQDVADMCLDI